jgi:hypothetical protein
MLRDHAVGEFVEEHGNEKEQTHRRTQEPLLRVAQERELLPESHGQGISDGSKNKEPTDIQIDGDAKDFSDPQA